LINSGYHGNGDAWVVKLSTLPDNISMKENSVSKLTAYLSSTNLQISFSSNSIESQIQLFDISGRLLFKNSIVTTVGLNTFLIPIPELARGVYIVKVNNQVTKLIAD